MDTLLLIESKRLLLRPIRPGDSEALFKYRSNAAVNQYQGWIPKSIQDARDFISHQISPEINLPGTWFQWAIINKETDELIGDLGCHFLKSNAFQVELGCTLDIDFQGKGFAAEALSSLIDYLFRNLNKQQLFASIDPQNIKSIRLFERLGFRKQDQSTENMVAGTEYPDDLCLSIRRAEWLNV